MENQDSRHIISPLLSSQELTLDKPARLGVMASGSGSNFEIIAQQIEKGKLNAQIPVVVYNIPEAKVKEKAAKHNIPTVLLNHKNFKTREDLDEAIIKTFRENNVEWVIMAGWMRIITNRLLNAFRHRVINIHPSLLPSFKGIRAVEQAIDAKVKITGCTVHFASLEVDSGEILMQAAVPILAEDTPETLHARIQVQEHIIFPKAIALAIKKSQEN